MGNKRDKGSMRSHTMPSSPSHSFSSSSSSDFEFTISISPRKSSPALCPADELFYKGQLLPLHLSPRISMVRTLLLSSSSISSSSDTSTTASRDSTGSTDSSSSFTSDLARDLDSSRPSSVAEDDELKRLNGGQFHHTHMNKKTNNNKYFSLSRISSVFKKEPKNRDSDNIQSGSSVKRMSATAREVIRKYLKKVKPLYEKLSQKQQQQKVTITNTSSVSLFMKPERSVKEMEFPSKTSRKESNGGGFSHSFSGNLRYPRRRSCISSCPSSMRSSPSHSGVLARGGSPGVGMMQHYTDVSSMEELQNAIQGAIAHCKNSMKRTVSNEIET